MPAIVNVSDVIKISIMAFVAVWCINYLLKQAGLSQYAA